jgi:hypothetical protein
MRRTTLVPATPTVIGFLAYLTGLPTWCAITVTLTGLTLAAGQVVVTQIIRLRDSGRITTTTASLQVLEIEDLPARRASSRAKSRIRPDPSG